MNRLLLLFFLAATSAWAQDPPFRAPTVEYIQKKLQTIIIPEIEFEETPFPDAIEFLVAKSRELDPDPDPARRGISVIIRNPNGRPGLAPNVGFDFPKITMHRKNISIDEAFRTLAELGGFQFRIPPWGKLVLEPLPDARAKAIAAALAQAMPKRERQATRDASRFDFTYLMPAAMWEFIENWQTKDPFAGLSTSSPPSTLPEILKSVGVTFPEGTEVHYDPASAKFTAHQTPDNLDQIEAYLDRMFEEWWRSQPENLATVPAIKPE